MTVSTIPFINFDIHNNLNNKTSNINNQCVWLFNFCLMSTNILKMNLVTSVWMEIGPCGIKYIYTRTSMTAVGAFFTVRVKGKEGDNRTGHVELR